MADSIYVPVRLPSALVKRLDKLVKPIAADPRMAAFGRVSRSTVIRLAIAEGLTALEREYLGQTAKRGAAGSPRSKPASPAAAVAPAPSRPARGRSRGKRASGGA